MVIYFCLRHFCWKYPADLPNVCKEMQTRQDFFYYDYQSSQQYCEAIRNGLLRGLYLLFIKDNASCYLSVPCRQHRVSFFEEAHLSHVALGVRFCPFSCTHVSWNETSHGCCPHRSHRTKHICTNCLGPVEEKHSPHNPSLRSDSQGSRYQTLAWD